MDGDEKMKLDAEVTEKRVLDGYSEFYMRMVGELALHFLGHEESVRDIQAVKKWIASAYGTGFADGCDFMLEVVRNATNSQTPHKEVN